MDTQLTPTGPDDDVDRLAIERVKQPDGTWRIEVCFSTHSDRSFRRTAVAVAAGMLAIGFVVPDLLGGMFVFALSNLGAVGGAAPDRLTLSDDRICRIAAHIAVTHGHRERRATTWTACGSPTSAQPTSTSSWRRSKPTSPRLNGRQRPNSVPARQWTIWCQPR